MKFNFNKIIRVAIPIVIIAIIIAIFFAVLFLINQNKIVYNLKIANISLGELTYDQARVKLEKQVNKFLSSEIILRYNENEKIYTASPKDLGIKIFFSSVLDQAIKTGHKDNLFYSLKDQFLALTGYYNLSLNYKINQKEVENFIKNNLNDLDNPATNATWKYDDEVNDFVFIKSQSGVKIDRKNLLSQLLDKIQNLNQKDISLKLIDDYPEIYENETKYAYEKAQKILSNAPYELIVIDPLENKESTKIPLLKEDLYDLLDFIPVKDKNNSKNIILGATLNNEKLKEYLTSLAPSINKPPVNAEFELKNNRVTAFKMSQNGLKLKINENISKIKNEISKNYTKQIKLEIAINHPDITTDNINNLGINSLLGKGESNFYGSTRSRIHNINIGAAKFDGVLLNPDEEFSFNEILGEVGPKQGYLPELVIKKDKTIPEYGGGLCQVSTTAFRAAVNSGLKITERYPHSFPVGYYNPQGFDATIYPPHPDLKFINNTPRHLLVQTKIKGYKLIFEFYGTNDGRKIVVEGPYQYDIKPDGSMKAMLTRKIYKDEELIDEKTWYSNYKSPAKFPVQRNPLE